MTYRTLNDFPQWVLDYEETQSYIGNRNCWPKDFQKIAEELQQKANEIAAKWKGVGENKIPYNRAEIDTYMGARDNYYESYPVFCANEGFRPDEWDNLHDSEAKGSFSRCGSFYEAKIGNWYLVLGFDYD